MLAAAWWYVARGGSIAAPDGADLGRTTAGVRPADLNVIVITLDTTRWDRIGAYGDRVGLHSQPRSSGDRGRPLRTGDCVGSADAALPRDDAHGTYPAAARGARQRAADDLAPACTALAEALSPRVATKRPRSSARSCSTRRFGLDQGFDVLRRPVRRREVQGGVARRRGPAGERGRRQRDAVARGAGGPAVLRVAALLRRPLALRSARAVQIALPRSPLCAARSPTSTTRSAACSGGWRAAASRTAQLSWSIGDHGESLTEHGEGTHGLFIYDATTRVPLHRPGPVRPHAGPARSGALFGART